MTAVTKEAAHSAKRVKIELKMTLLSDAIFGNGMSVPGEEDISVLTDQQGFPYYKGSTFKGVFREEMDRYIKWNNEPQNLNLPEFFGEGKPGADSAGREERKLVFSDFVLSPYVRQVILDEIGDNPMIVLESMSNMRAFTRISEDGTAAKGSLRYARCINQGLVFYGTITCSENDIGVIKEVLPLVKWIGTLRNRGFGNVRVEVERDEEETPTGEGGEA